MRLVYAENGQTVIYALGETWTGGACETQDYAVTWAREFRYDSGRQRYLSRELDPEDLTEGTVTPLSSTWTDYDGDEPYGDFTVSGGTPTNQRSFELGWATVDPYASSGDADTSYFHTDLIGTTRSMSDDAGAAASAVTYTAFGERVSGTEHRYGYAGAFGYQSHDDLPFLHVGARYYDPASGRFLQRDPIGIAGGLNVFWYAHGLPSLLVDPDGLNPPGGEFAPGPDYPRLPGGWLDPKGYKIVPKRPRPIPRGGFWRLPKIGPPQALACVGAAALGYGIGRGLDWGIEKATGKSLSERIGDGLFYVCPSCWTW